MAEGSQGQQEIVTNLTYKVNIDQTGMALGLGQVGRGFDSHVVSAIGGLGAAFKGAMMDPLSAAMGMPSMSGAGGGRMMLSQSMAAGWQNLETSAREYTQLGFYQNMAFGTHPEFGSAGLRNKLMMQQAYAAGPLLPGSPTTSEEMRNMSEQAMAPFAGLLGVQKPAGQMIASAYQSGMMDYTVGARQQMEAHKQIFSLQGANRVYQMDPTQGGQLFTSVLAAGTPANQAGGAYIEALRAQVAGVPLGQSMGALGTANQYLSFMQQTGNAGPNASTQGYAGGLIQGQLVAQKLQNDGYIVTEQQRAAFGSTVTQLNAMNGRTDRDRIDNAVMAAQMAYGQAAAHIDGDFIAGADARQKYMDHEQVALSERMSAGRLSMERMMDPRSLLRDALGEAGAHLPTPMRDFVNRATGYGPYAPGEASGLSVSPGGAGTFSKTAWGAFPTTGANIRAAGRMAEIADAHKRSDASLSTDPTGALEIMGKAGGKAGSLILESQLQAYIKDKGSKTSELKDFAKNHQGLTFIDAMLGGKLATAGLSAALSTDIQGFLGGEYSQKYYGAIEDRAKKQGDPTKGAEDMASVYTGAGLDPSKSKDNDAYFGVLSKISGGMDHAEAVKGLSHRQKGMFKDRLSGMTVTENASGGFDITGHNMNRDVGQLAKWTVQKEIQSGAINNALPGMMSGIGGALQYAIGGANGATKDALQGYAKQLSEIGGKTPGEQAGALQKMRDEGAGSHTKAGTQVAKIIDAQLLDASGGTGSASPMASMPFSTALMNASNALSILGTVAAALSKGRGSSPDGSN